MTNPKDFFQENSYLVIRNFISKDIALLLYHYCINKVKRTDFMKFYDRESYKRNWDGEFGDEQAPNVYNHYGDPVMDSLLELSTESVQNYIGLNLQANYSYWRFYQHGSVLERHRDRDSCEISATLCLGYDVSNVDLEKFPNYNWPIFVERNQMPNDLNGLPISMDPGDILIYRGCDVDHWRERYLGLNHAQVFLHYNDTSGPFRKRYDGRPILGIPKKFQTNDDGDY